MNTVLVFLSSFVLLYEPLQRGNRGRERNHLQNKPPTCSMTSGAIQHGVPTNVFRTLFLVMSPPAARKALTPKSGFGMFKRDVKLAKSYLDYLNIKTN